MDCEEDTNSLPSLFHSILPADNTSTPVSSTGQLHNWPGQDESNVIGGHFSPVSPPAGYSNSNHGMSESSNPSKFFCSRPSTSHNHAKSNIIMGYSRPDHSLLPMTLTGQNPSVSHSTPSITSSTSSDFVLNSASHGGNEQINFYYDQAHGFRNAVSAYEGHRDDFGHVGQHLSVNHSDNVVLSHSGYSNDHGVLEIDKPQITDSMAGIMARSSLANSHTSSGDIIPVSPTLFDARAKQMDYSKEMPIIYESSTSKSGLGSMASERRPVEVNNLVNDLEFSVSSRDLAAMNSSSMNNNNDNQFDNTSISRQVQDFDFRLDHGQDGNAYTINQDQSSLKFSDDTDSINRRSTIWGYSGFQVNTQQQQHSEELNFNSNQKKVVLNEPGDVGSKGQDLGVQFQRLESHVKPVSSSGRLGNIVDESRQSNIQISHAFHSWSGRTRAHRKMAKLLGQTIYNEKTMKSQATESCISTSRPISFPKIQPSVLQTSFREAHRVQENPSKFHYPQGYQREHTNNTQLLPDSDRDARSIPYNLGHDQGSKRDDEVNKHHVGMRDFNLPVSFGLASEGHPASISKEQSSLLSNSHLLPTTHLDLDFPQTLSLDSSHEPVGQDDLFNNSIDNQHISQQSLAFPDNLNPQHSQELNLESYLNSTTDKDLDLIRKYPDQVQRELATDNDFDFDEYIESSRLTQTYFERPSNLPQDMTLYQKSSPDKFGGSDNTSFMSKDRDSFHGGKTVPKQTGLSELQTELTKTSTKENLKGIRIPRDINRAMEILQDMQEDERAEERRKEELQKHFQNEMQEQKDQQQQQQQQHQIHHQSIGINSSPKKVFQNKHQTENLSLTDQQFLGESASFIEEQSVSTVNFLDQPPLVFSESQQQPNTEFCDPSLQDMPSYSSFPASHSITEIDLSIMNKREQQNEGYQNVNSVLDNHVLKKIALSTSTKDHEMNSSLSSLSMSTGLTSNIAAQPGHDLSFSMLGTSRFSDQPNLPTDSLPNRSNLPVSYSFMEQERMRHDLPYQSKDGDLDKSQSFQVFRNEPSNVASQEMHNAMGREADLMDCARRNLYMMMKQEQLCDAVLSISKQNVKVHQVILCSMSNYLRNLLLKTQPSSRNQISSASYDPDPYGVALVINCETIRSSSVAAFLMFIYLGKTDFTESNVVDLFILASSLHVSPLRDLCQQYMWRVHISEEQLKIPQVHVINTIPGKQNQACQVNLNGSIATEDKCVNTGSVVKSMPATTQTDTSRSGVGGGGQEEWVMLKKTKQKTVSPSKTKYGCAGKSTSSTDTSLICRHGKKGWLSPKRRFKTEQHLAQARLDTIDQDVLQEKLTESMSAQNNDAQSQASSVMNRLTLSKPPSELSNYVATPCLSQTSSEIGHDANVNMKQINAAKTEQSEDVNQGIDATLPSRAQKTTVEIAEEAAAAKSAAHSYGTRLSGRGCNKQCVSYSGLVHAYDKKKSTQGSREKPSLIKKKDFVKNHTSADINSSKPSSDVSSNLSKTLERMQEKVVANGSRNSGGVLPRNDEVASIKGLPPPPPSNVETDTGYKTWKSVVGKPLKKNIAQRAQDSELASDPSGHAHSTSTSNCLMTADDIHGGEDIIDASAPVPTSSNVTSSNIAIVSEGDLTNVSSIIDSLVNTFESEGGDTDLQIVLGDLDTELGNTLLPPTISTPSSTMAPISVSKPTLSTIKESPLPAHLPLPSTSLSSSTSHLSSSPQNGASGSVVSHKTKTTPQGYRKRLIQLMKSENAKDSSASPILNEHVSVPEIIDSRQAEGQSQQNDRHVKNFNVYVPFISNSTVCPSDENKNGSCRQEVSQEKKEPGHAPGCDEKHGNDFMFTGNKNTEEDLNLSAKYEEETQFHKIFKRRRKAKFRKSLGNEIETPNVKVRSKKSQGSDQEGGNNVKGRHRRNTANDSDSGSSRPKVRKMPSNDTDSSVLKVRPPPKKRAKMELELMKVANKKSDLAVQESQQKENESVAQVESKRSETGHPEMETSTDSSLSEKQECDKPENGSNLVNEMPKVIVVQSKERKVEKNSEEKPKKLTTEENIKMKVESCVQKANVGKKSMRKDSKEIRRYVQILDEKLRNSNVATQFFSCKFCRAQLKSAKRTVKHVMSFHEIAGSEVLDFIAIGDEGKTNEVNYRLCLDNLKQVDEKRKDDAKKKAAKTILMTEGNASACDICGYVTKDTTYKYMHYHKYFKHNIPLPKGWSLCKCHICDKECHSNFHLKEHIQTHSDNFFFVCWYCGQNFKTRNSFNSHIFHKHTKERKHLCKICNKSFKTWTQLKIHVRSHTGERPFTCTHCSYGSTIQGNMRYHLANKHGMEKSKVEESMKKITSKTPEMNPAALEELMAAVLAKTIPDKALKEPKKRRAKPQKEKSDQKGRNENKKSSPKTVKRETCASTTTTSSSVTAQVKAFLSDKASSSIPRVFSSSEVTSSSSAVTGANMKTPVCVPVNSSSTSSPSKDLQANLSKQPLKIAPKDCGNPVISQIVSGNQVVVFPPVSSSSSPSSSAQDLAFLQTGAAAIPASMSGYTLLPTHLLPGISGPSSLIADGTADQKQPLLLVSPSGVLSTGSVVETQESAGFQISDINSATPQVNIILNNSTNPTSSQYPNLHFPAVVGARGLPNTRNPPLVQDTVHSVSEDGCYVASSLQGQVGPYLLYANPSAVGQQVSLSEAGQQGMQPLFISYPGFPGHQIIQGLPELQFIPQTQDGVTTTSGDLIPVLLTEQLMGTAEVVEHGDEDVSCQQEEVVLALGMRQDDKKEVKKEGQTVTAVRDAETEGGSIVLISSDMSHVASAPQETSKSG